MTPEIKIDRMTITIEQVRIDDIPAPTRKARPGKWQAFIDDLAKRLETTNGTYALRYDFPDKKAGKYAASIVRKRIPDVIVQTRLFDGCVALFISHNKRKPYKDVR